MDIATGVEAYVGALALTALASLLLGAFVATRARALPGGVLLAMFLAGVAAWSAAQAVPALIGPAAAPFTTILIALSPLPAAAFVHLVFAFALCGALRPVALVSYAVATFATLIGLIFGVGEVVPWHGFPGMFVPSPAGWSVLGVAAALSVAGHLRLAQTWREQQGLHKRQAGAMFVSSLIGLVALTGFAFPALGLEWYPWPILLLPLYSVALVYGILRHRFMAVNLWARRGLVWLMLVALAGAASAAIATLPLALAGRPAGLFGTWFAMAVALAIGILILAPLKRLADRIVFPGGRVSETDIAIWRDRLAEAIDVEELERFANDLLARRLAMPAGEEGPAITVAGDMAALIGWDDAPPATRHLAERFAALVGEAARRLAAAARLVDAERERQQQARLVELGQLAATVAHDLRNPLGIVKMAATGAPADVRAEIGEQVARMDHLVADILDYSRAWTVRPEPVRLTELVGHAGVEADVPDDLMVMADRRAIARVLANLIDNGRALGSRVAVIAKPGPAVTLDVCDDGPGVPPEIADSLFRPFVSRRQGGTGLGLAIVQRIMEAHGGSVTLAQRPGWSTCFRLTFGDPR
ncbi:two-component sensor histidine kinase [Sphingomonas oleivorans]|uniref:histidine kinase n=1 Tax=Sphingomonas oleivorans TaxID=1735121 RepID=A0A2T5FZU6_9SPHN|nr:sensor histidine kinase [Sphingomonas oleivorans]PTQ12208.1 two-component sensor histidine kinase [Sphingomonas oleivorans]